MGIFSDAVTVESSPEGVPLRLWWHGECYSIAPHPLCWYERRPWWERDSRVRPGEGVGVVDTQMWRLQLRHEDGRGIGGGADEGLSIDVVRYRPAERWRVIKIYDAVEESFKEEQDSA